jgi:hypothetical protein
MMDKWWQIAGIAGILFVISFIVGAAVSGEAPMHGDDAETITEWFADNGEQYLIGDFINGLGFILFYFPFLVGLYARLRAAEAEPAMFSRVALIGGIILPLAGLTGGVFLASLALLEGAVSDEVAVMAVAASFHAFSAVSAISAIIMGAAAIVIVRTGVFWAWLGWLGAALAIAAIIGSYTVVDGDPEGVFGVISIIAFIGFGVWILAASAALLMQGRGAAMGAPMAQAAT